MLPAEVVGLARLTPFARILLLPLCAGCALSDGKGWFGCDPAPSDTDAVDLSGEFAGGEVYLAWSLDLGDPGTGTGSVGRGYPFVMNLEEAPAGPAYLMASTLTGDSGGVLVAGLGFSFDGLAVLREHDAGDAQDLEEAIADAGYTIVDRDATGWWPSRFCAYAGDPDGTVSDGDLQKWCADMTVDAGTVRFDPDGDGATFTWCTEPSLCGGEGVEVSLDADTVAALPFVTYTASGSVVGVYVEMDGPRPEEPTVEVVAHAMLQADVQPNGDDECLSYTPSEAEPFDADDDGFYWYQTVTTQTWE
jgi:hypothetical protein